MFQRIALILSIVFLICGCGGSPSSTPDAMDQSTADTSANAPSAGPITFTGPRDALFSGPLRVDVMALAAPLRANELAERLQAAARANPNWWLEHTRNAPPGEPLPYDSRMRLSAAEYQEFLELSKKLTVLKKGEARLSISHKEDGVYILHGGQTLPDFTGIAIDLKNDQVHTPFGVLTERSDVEISEGSAIGPWMGVEWQFSEIDPQRAVLTSVRLAVGILKESGRGVIHYTVKDVRQNQQTRIMHVLFYDLPPTG